MNRISNQIKLLLLILFFGCAFSGGAGAAPKTVNHAQNAYDAGMAAYEKQEFQNAVYAFQNSIDYDPKFYKSYYMLGMALFMNKETNIAIRVLKNTIKQFPQEWRAQALLGEYYAGLREYDVSISYYKQALESKKLSKSDRPAIEKNLATVEKEQAAQWRVSEDEKSKILKAVETKLERKWRPAVIEKRGEDLHIVYSLRDDDYRNDKWKQIVDIKCYTQKKEFGYEYVNERLVADYREKDAELDTIDQDSDSRIYETRVSGKPKTYIVGRIFSSPLGYCVAQVISRSNLKEKDVLEWTDTLKEFKINAY